MNKQIQWQNNRPYNTQYQDIYFSVAGGLAESRHVFIEGNNLRSRWQNLKAGEEFTIFEAGFGSGLNFLTTWQLWLEIKPLGKLCYITCENNPFNKRQYSQALEPFSDSMPELIQQFLSIIQQPTDTISHFALQSDVELVVINCDINSLATVMPPSPNIDAVYLDGFSPAKNPEMWSVELCKTLFKNSSAGASAATYSVAGNVKRNLSSAGFTIQKKPGFGTKREMLYAYKAAT
ncbi:MAG: tRNA (5-methylaminomethyl-2-thiouridine)(34)-methyltransferase MnmD [Gammaproteobacteria bacterium]|nr:tRNA (5-methylaminomethyl-2-thiouridine)(34)-methyltransferase MnmD [Gammaproteobacteria bacterium]NNJ72338.1 tRNA (5-methylaminomethyl-2-thiouridine)(34)-methyltransferase MnmD [Enterobacterales bacterium]